MHTWRLQGPGFFRIMAATGFLSLRRVKLHNPGKTGGWRGWWGKSRSEIPLSPLQPGPSISLLLHHNEIAPLPGWRNG